MTKECMVVVDHSQTWKEEQENAVLLHCWAFEDPESIPREMVCS